MIQNPNKRRRIEVSCTSSPEDASSFYKRLGLDLLAPSSATSGQSQETLPKRKFSVQKTNLKATQNHSPLTRSDREVQHWLQTPQKDRQAHSYYLTPNTRVDSVNTATNSVSVSQYSQSGRPHGNQSSRSQGYQTVNSYVNQSGHVNGYQASRQLEYQTNHSNGYQKTHHHGYQFTRQDPLGLETYGDVDFAFDDTFHWAYEPHQSHQQQMHPRVDMMTSHPHQSHQTFGHHPHPQQPQTARPVSRPRPKPAKKEPQVKLIDKYSCPDYVELMYHPTPTLEDLGLTSFLDSPPSSPRALSPARATKQTDVAAAANKTRQTMTTEAAHIQQSVHTDTAKSRQPPITLAPWKLIKIDIPPVSRVTLEDRIAAVSKQTGPEPTESKFQGPQIADPAVGLDLFGCMSPFSCWSQTTPVGDARFS
ncbi:uncharacterized protein LOC144624851 [Crassostrea virginica]